MIFQELLKQRRRFSFFPEIEKRPGNLMSDQCGIGVARNRAQNRKRLVILTLKIQRLPDSELGEVIIGIRRKSELRFLERLGKRADVTIDKRKLIARLIQTWVQRQRLSIFHHRSVVRKVI